MKKTLLLLTAILSVMAASAQKITFKNLHEMDPDVLANARITSVENPAEKAASLLPPPSALKKASYNLVNPEGTMRYYNLSAVVRDLSGLMPVMGVAEKLYFTADGKNVYFGSLFPSILKCEDIWAKGVVNGNDVMIDCYDEIYHMEIKDAEGNVAESRELHIGELLVDQYGNPYGLDDVHFTKDGDRYYIDYSDVDLRPIILFCVESNEDVTVLTTAYNHDLRPYEGNTELNELPADATVSDYIYSGQDTNGKDFTLRGRVGVSGNDYYFDSLLPEAGFAWIKGTRKGNTITLENDQFLGTDISYYLYYNGFKTTGFDYSAGQYAGEKTKLTFSIDDDGVITLNNATRTFPCAFFPSGNQFFATFQNRLEPYRGDAIATPADPYDLKLVTKYFAQYGENSISFELDHMTPDNKYINPDNLYYCMWLDDEVYTFEKDLYPYLHEDAMQYFPYGYKDQGNYDIYMADDGRNVICFREDMFVQCGIQAVYRVDGKESRSNIVYVDEEGNIEKVAPEGGENEGMTRIELRPQSNCWFDLSGRRAAGKTPGQIYVKDGRRSIAQ